MPDTKDDNSSATTAEKQPNSPANQPAVNGAGSTTKGGSSMLNLKKKHQQWKNLSTKHKAFVLAAALLIVGGSYGIAHALLGGSSEPELVITKHQKPSTVPSPLTGRQVKPALAKRPVTAVMIENSLDARPQSGLAEAGIIFEAIAEGGITRFVALYQEAQPQYVGPVRSLRPYYIDWGVAPFRASIAHVGGSPEALKQIRSSGRDLDQFFNPGTYWRVGSRIAPHNMYTSFRRLDALNKSKNYRESDFVAWPRRKAVKPVKIQASKISLAISSGEFNVTYGYNPKTNTYLRSEGGAAHGSTSRENGPAKRLQPDVVIAIVVPYGLAADGHHSVYHPNGTGLAYIFQNGKVIRATWKKNSRKDQLRFLDSAGQRIPLNPGQTWVTAVASKAQVSFR